MTSKIRASLFGISLLLTSCSHGSGQGAATAGQPAEAGQGSAAGQAAGKPGGGDPIASFALVQTVLQSPRCVNCHPVGDAPMQGDESAAHNQNVLRGPQGLGMPGQECSSCHGKANLPPSYGLHQPPGVASGWRLPPPEHKLVFQGMSAHDLCEQLKDPQRNGGKDMAALTHHMAEDPLTVWGWSPGFGRAPVQVPHAEFVAAFKTWADKGAPCPQ